MTALGVGDVMRWNGSLWVNATVNMLQAGHNILNYGAEGDGTTNDYTAVQAAITDSAGLVLDGAGLTYKVNTGLSLVSGMTLQNCTLDFSSLAASATAIAATSTRATAVSLTADLTYGSRTLTVTSTSGLSEGDWLFVASGTAWSSEANLSELFRVRSVDSATQVTLETPTNSTFATSAGATFKKCNLEVQNVTLRNVTIVGAGNGQEQQGLKALYCYGIKLEAVTFRDFDAAGAVFSGSINCRVRACDFRKANRAGSGYGVSIEGCRGCSVKNSWFSWMRHGISLGGDEISRYVNLQGNHVDYCGDAGIDSHSAAQFVTIQGNTVACNDSSADWAGNHDGIMFQGADAVIKGNIVRRPADVGIWAQLLVTGADKAPSVVIQGNQIVEPGNRGIYVLNQGQTMRGVVVNGNTVKGARGTNASIQVYALSKSIFQTAVNSNVVEDSLGVGIYLRGLTVVDSTDGNMYSGSCVGNAVHVSEASGSIDGIILESIKRFDVVGNNVEVTNPARIGCNCTGSSECHFTGNTFALASVSTGICLQLTGTGTGCSAQGNRFINGNHGLFINTSQTAAVVGVNDGTGCTSPLTVTTAANPTVVRAPRVSADKGDAAATLTAGTSEPTQRWATPLTTDRAVTLSTTNAWSGAAFRITRTAAATGASNLNVGTGPLKALAVGTWCDVEFDGSAWLLTGYGAL